MSEVRRLIAAVQADDVMTAGAILTAGTPVDELDSRRRTALDSALFAYEADQCGLQMVRILLEAGANTGQLIGKHQETAPLQFAAQRGLNDLLRLLLDFGADPNQVLQGDLNSVLVRAVTQGSPDMVQTLIAVGASVDSLGPARSAPLGAAASTGRPELVKLLLDAGARVETGLLREARESELRASLAVLPDQQQQTHDRYGEVVALLNEALGFNGSSDPETLLAAVRAGDTATVQRLVDDGVPANIRGHEDRTALDLALYAYLDERRPIDSVRILLDAGADIEQLVGEPPLRRPLSLATARRDPDLLRVLLEGGADPDACSTPDSPSPISVAARDPLPISLRLLIQAGAKVNPEGNCHHRPLSDAAAAGHAANVELLLEAGARPEYRLLQDAHDGRIRRSQSGESPVRMAKYGTDPDWERRYAETIEHLERVLL